MPLKDAIPEMRCSFCHKDQGVCAKLISSPRGEPRAYICDECIVTCADILEDEQPQHANPLLAHPLASDLLAAVEHWIRAEMLGNAPVEEFAEVRRIAARMFSETP